MSLMRTGMMLVVVLLVYGASMQCMMQCVPIVQSSQVVPMNSPSSLSSDNATQYYAVICACSRYENPNYNIPKFSPAPESKLRVVYDALVLTTNWEEDHIILLLNQNATKQNILTALDVMSGRVGPDDVFLFTWNGHGSRIVDCDGDEAELDPNDTYDEVICPYDIEKSNDTLTNSITDDELGYYFSRIHAKGKCLIFESCLSGGLVDQYTSEQQKEATAFRTAFLQDITAYGTMDVDGNDTIVMMSTFPTTLGRATYTTHSPLLYAVAHTITHSKRYDKNDDGVLSAEEVFRKTRQLTIIQSSLMWMPIWVGEYLIYKHNLYMLFSFLPKLVQGYRFLDKLVPMPLLLATGLLVFVYVGVQVIMKMMNGYYVLNWPNMQDDYLGEFPLVEL